MFIKSTLWSLIKILLRFLQRILLFFNQLQQQTTPSSIPSEPQTEVLTDISRLSTSLVPSFKPLLKTSNYLSKTPTEILTIQQKLSKEQNSDGVIPTSTSSFAIISSSSLIDNEIKLHDIKINKMIEDIDKIPHSTDIQIPHDTTFYEPISWASISLPKTNSIQIHQLIELKQTSIQIQKDTLKELRSFKQSVTENKSFTYNYKRNSLRPSKTKDQWLHKRMKIFHSLSTFTSLSSSNSNIVTNQADCHKPPSDPKLIAPTKLPSLDDTNYSSPNEIRSREKSSIHVIWTTRNLPITKSKSSPPSLNTKSSYSPVTKVTRNKLSSQTPWKRLHFN